VPKVDSLPFSVGYASLVALYLRPDSSVTPVALVLQVQRHQPQNVSIGGLVALTNRSGGDVEVSLPTGGQGLHFSSAPTQTTDTIPANKYMLIQMDSVGTYTLQYRLLTTGAVLENSFIAQEYP
jgi:hypothetical protein